MRIPFSPYTKVTPVDLLTRMKFCLVDGRVLWCKYYILRSKSRHVCAKFKAYNIVAECFVMKDLESVMPESKAFSKDCPQASLCYITLSTSLASRHSWTSHVSLPNTNGRCCSRNGWLKPFPHRRNLHPQRFLKECAAAELFSHFLLNFHWILIAHFVEWNSSTWNIFFSGLLLPYK
jgi:hypothetical protein